MDSATLIVAATRSEARYAPAGSRVLITGIGKVRAATTLTRVLAGSGDAPIRQVLNIGTAGALHDHHAGLFLPSVVVEHDISSAELRLMGYPVVDRWEMPDGDGSVLASGDTFVADPVRRAALAADADLVDMEGCAIAHVCAEFGVPCRLVKVVSDGADENSLDWPVLVDAAARQLGDWLGRH
ncbi:nucleosidase [Gordonia sp. CPCC 206044]|uniref:nucleosidase n=1 Tax=Gordonia sp. CPCC 206044 TaxID=3140793 RepID=UPI003AF35E69